jgi:hypothetical protein
MPFNIQGGDFSNINDFDAASEVPRMIVQTIGEGVVFLTRDLLVGDQKAKQGRIDNFYKPSRSRKSPTTPRPPKAPKPRKKKSFVNKSLAAKAVGIGTRKQTPRAANSNDIKRAGRTALSRGNRALARFIAARYSPNAIAKYNDYAGRLSRSKRLIKQIVEIDANTFRIKKHIVRTSTDGLTPYSCTCPDFSQFSDDARTWLGSKAGPFNPCKHMMAVRDRFSGGGSGAGWNCNNGICTFSAVSGVYATKALCEAALIPPLFTGGQCAVRYRIRFEWGIYDVATNTRIGGSFASFTCSDPIPCIGPLGSPSFGSDATFKYVEFSYNDGTSNVVAKLGSVNKSVFDLRDLVMSVLIGVDNPSRCDGGVDNCGNAAGTCP